MKEGYLSVHLSVLLVQLLTFALLVVVTLVGYYLIHIGNKHVSEDYRIHLKYRRIGKILLGIAIFLLLYRIFTANKVLNEFFISFIMALFFAYLINPAVKSLNRRWNIPEWLGVLIVYLLVVAVLVVLAISVIPRTTEEFAKLVRTLPTIMEKGRDIIFDYGNSLSKTFGHSVSEKIVVAVDENVQQIIMGLRDKTIGTLGKVVSGLSQVFAKMINVVMVPIMTYFLVIDRKKIKEFARNLLPEKYREDAAILSRQVNQVMDDFVRGRIIMAIFVGMSTMVMLLIFRVEFAIVIGIVTMIADVIPYIGPFLGLLPALIFAYLSSPLKALWVTLFFIFLQWAENNIVAPKVLSTTVGLHPLVVFITIILAGRLYGVLGMVISVPIVAALIIVIKFAVKKLKRYQESRRQERPLD